MSDSESIKKMLRSVLQSSKTGVSIARLQSDYQLLCGEIIPLKKLGFVKLEDYLRSIPSVVRLEYQMGDVKCFAAVCKETAHIAELVAKQKSSKKSGCSQVVNCRMRFKPSNPYMLNVNQRSLRQPLATRTVIGSANRSWSRGGYRGCSASGDYRQLDHRLSTITPVEHRQPAPQTAVKLSVTTHRKEQGSSKAQKLPEKPTKQTSTANKSQSSVYDVELVQTRLTLLLEKYSNGLWMSKLADIYSEMFNQKLHPQVLIDLEKWTHICMVEQSSSNNRVNRVIYPPLPLKHAAIPRSSPSESSPKLSSNSTITTPISSPPSIPKQISNHLPAYPEPKPRVFPKSPLAKATFIFSQQPVAVSSGNPLSSPTLHSPDHNPAPQLPPCVGLDVNATGGCEANQATDCRISSSPPGPGILPTLNSASASPPKPSITLATEVVQRIKDLLSKYSQGIWAHALPKLFMDTYKTPFPEHILDSLSNYLHIWNVEYPISHNKKAILYTATTTDMDTTDCEESPECRSHPLPSGLQVLSDVVPHRLVPPSEQFPSVLITDVKSSNAVTIRYVGENYSYAQEAMEDAMRAFYSQSVSCRPLPNPVVGQLVAVREEDGNELARGQVMEIMSPKRVKVYYVDHGFSVEISGDNLLELHHDFLSLPFQAANVRLAGLEAFSSHPLLVSCLGHLTVDKILLVQRLELCQPNETPLVVLYDTSQDDDVNINSACLKALQDTTMNNPLSLNATYREVCVTHVCEDGIYCQLPSRGKARLSKLLQQTEAILNAQVSSEPLVSRPFIGKICLARYKGQWFRVEVTNMYGSRVMEISFIDIGVSATVEVTDLREIPPPLLKDSVIIPAQAVKCRLADLPIPDDDWSPKVVQWLKETVLGSEDCTIKIVKLEEHKGNRLVHMYLFVGVDSQDLDKSVNRQLANSWALFSTRKNNATISNNINEETGLCALVQMLTLDSSAPGPNGKPSGQPHQGSEDLSFQNTASISPTLPLPLPPPLVLPQPGQNMDVFVSVACHPGHFVLQPWQDLHKLEVLTGEMILYYNQTENTQSAVDIQKQEVYAAKMDKTWHRVQVKGVLTNGWVSVYELDYGRHELVRSTFLRPLLEEFRQLPFQTVTAQLAGVTQTSWSEEACMLFRNHVEKRALVAQIESVQELSEVKGGSWERKLTVYLVDTTVDERDLWIHSIMADISSNLSSAA
ncbi:tudor domain-containing protein 7A isoform X2 [Betta splendens]|nr:tudor domain-containing protein 7A isoform X2 [Betta splendens]